MTPDTILRWQRRLIARKWTFVSQRPGRPRLAKKISWLIVRMATDNPAWGYSRIQGALKNLDREDHFVIVCQKGAGLRLLHLRG